MAADYKEKLPQATIDSIIGEAKPVVEETPLNTPDVAGGSVVAPGIVEAPVVDTMDVPVASTNVVNSENVTPIAPTLEPPVVNPVVPNQEISPLDSGGNVSPIENSQPAVNASAISSQTAPVQEVINPISANPLGNESAVSNSMSSDSVNTNSNVTTNAINNVSNDVNATDLEKEMESVILEAQNIFLESAKNLANKIIAEAIQKVRDKSNLS